MFHHQNSFAQVNELSRCFAASQIFSPVTSWFAWRQKLISAMSLKYQPLPTQPWPDGGSPVVNVDCTLHVTAGRIVASGRCAPRWANAASAGVCGPTSDGL